jgi:hypothetical protein
LMARTAMPDGLPGLGLLSQRNSAHTQIPPSRSDSN